MSLALRRTVHRAFQLKGPGNEEQLDETYASPDETHSSLLRWFRGLKGPGNEEQLDETYASPGEIHSSLLRWFRGLERCTEKQFREFVLPVLVDLSQFDPNQELPGPVQHRFFRPWSLARLEEHEKNDQKPDEAEQLFIMEAMLHSPNLGNERRTPESITWERTQCLCNRLAHEVQTFPRNGTKGNRLALKHLTGWRHGEGLPFDYDLQSNFAEVWAPGRTKLVFDVPNSWTLGRDIPHVKLSMFHEASAENGVILRSELLAIMATMITRLRMDSLKKHTVIPVMLFSFVTPRHGRIILAHNNGRKVVVRMSPLYPFFPQDKDSLPLFTRYLASEVDPNGVTTSLERKKKEDKHSKFPGLRTK